MKNKFAAILVFSLFLLCSCTKDIGKDIEKLNRSNYPTNIAKIMVGTCAVSGCHNTSSYQAAAGLNLETWSTMFKGSGSGSPVIPFSSKFSSLCYFINTYPELGIRNTPLMPLNGDPLSFEKVTEIKNWIDKGAPDINGTIMWSEANRKKFYAVNQGCDVVTVFDAETQLPMRFINVGNKPNEDTPHQVRVSPDGKYWYVIFVNNNIMQKFRCSDDSYVGDIPLTPAAAGTGPEDVQEWNTFIISKNGKRAYCTSLNANGRITAVDLENRKLLAFSGLLANPHGIALNPAEDKVYVGAQYSNYITVLDTSFSDAGTIFLENTSIPNNLSIWPHDLLLSADESNLLITCQQSNDVRVLDLSTNQVVKIIPTGQQPQEIIYSSVMHQYYVSCTEDYTTLPGATGILTRIDANSYNTTNIKCGYQPHGIAVDETKKLLYVLSRNVSVNGPLPHHTSECTGRNGFVNFVDLTSFKVLSKKYELSSDPYFIFARP
ncbi:hypothetical protein CNR22_08265 [Sphingobacteriaceae bacterium]|nr:hypothetical protein CNR22_08265 [Sphingobacteriaceae bacterium]